MADGSGFALPSGAAAGLVHIGTSDTSLARSQALSNIAKRERSVARAAVKPSKVITAEEQKRKRLGKMKQNVITSARLHVEEAQRGGFRGKWAMLTLTYRDDERWVAKQVTELLKCLRQYATRAGFAARYTWVLELTQRGRPHYHVLVWLPKGRTLPKPDKQGWWKYGMTRIEWARKAVGYLAKYASKGDDYDLRTLPRGARLSGFGGLSDGARIELRWWKLPGWLRQQWDQICDVGRIKGGYVNRETGEFLASPFLVIFLGGALILCEVIP
ncbi:replication initiation protein [Lysobacter sp. FW306-1B-D06B]|uniref:rolling circle replication-associated protein n=1 Tax=Lysobacter sp. FW306-1B-D06B TaxID=3140250 RepID=UPI003140BD17